MNNKSMVAICLRVLRNESKDIKEFLEFSKVTENGVPSLILSLNKENEDNSGIVISLDISGDLGDVFNEALTERLEQIDSDVMQLEKPEPKTRKPRGPNKKKTAKVATISKKVEHPQKPQKPDAVID